jgi:hypothetical protein
MNERSENLFFFESSVYLQDLLRTGYPGTY